MAEAGRMENALPYEPDYGVCYCGPKGRMVTTADGTAYCMSPDAQAPADKPCRDSANNAVAGPRLLDNSAPHYREDRTGTAGGAAAREPRVCVFVGSSFKDIPPETRVTGNNLTVRALRCCVTCVTCLRDLLA